MGSAEADSQEKAPSGWKRWLIRGVWVVLIALAGGLAILWNSREDIAGNLIDGYLADTGLEASYDIASIGAKRQVIENVVIGDPEAPDLTIERVTVEVAYGFGAPSIGAAILERPKLYGTYRGGQASFGALDPLLFAPSEEPSGLPAIDVTIRDGGALLETEFGDVGFNLNGSGRLDDGFAGKIAMVAPKLGVEGCAVQQATAYGDISITDGSPRLQAPVKLSQLGCRGGSAESAEIAVDLSLDDAFAKATGEFDIQAGDLAFAELGASALEGKARLSTQSGTLVFDHDLTFGNVQSDYGSAASMRVDGALRSGDGFSQTSWSASVEGEGVDLASRASAGLKPTLEAGSGTLLEPLLAKLNRGLAASARKASLLGDVTLRLDNDAYSVVIPEARLRSEEGETLVAVSRMSVSQPEGSSSMRLSGNLLTGGRDLPQITGRFDKGEGKPLTARLVMAEYGEGEDRLALPQLIIRQGARGGYQFAGSARVSGSIPGGAVERAVVPLNGRLSSSGGLSLGTQCEKVRFAGLSYYDLSLAGQQLTLCPEGQNAMLRYDTALAIGVNLPELAIEGTISESPAHFEAAKTTFSYPGGFELSDLAVTIGAEDNAVRLTSASVTGAIDSEIAGSFAGATAKLDAVPLDLDNLSGDWSYPENVLRVENARFTVSDRTEGEARFEPLVAEGALLTLDGSDIAALASLEHPASGTPITNVSIAHDLSSGEGAALINVESLNFGPALSVQDLSQLALGVIAYTNGTVTGEGQVAWTSESVTSSGAFRTDDLDLAAAFGPVTGLKGEIRFSDLLNLTTEPSQTIAIGSINPGIEALDGQVQFALTNGEIIDVEAASWPFMGGRLVMRPTTLRYGTDAEQRYTFEIIDLDAAKFVAQMELTNIGATGTFNGTVPIVFDAQGNGRIEKGLLISEVTGGNVSYIGELTYEDMGAISNFAFQSLRSLDYRQMSVELNGDLAGEIITRFSIDGVRQGEDASQNFITRRLAKLPIRFNVNVRSENFYELATMVRTFWDPDALPDPVDQGVLSSDGQLRITPPDPMPPPIQIDPPEKARRPDELSVQPPESETLP